MAQYRTEILKKYSVQILGKRMTSSIHSQIYWPLAYLSLKLNENITTTQRRNEKKIRNNFNPLCKWANGKTTNVFIVSVTVLKLEFPSFWLFEYSIVPFLKVFSAFLRKFLSIWPNFNIKVKSINDFTPSRTPRISGLKSQILKPTFLS